MHGHVPAIFIAFKVIPILFAGGFLYLMYQISKSLKNIASHLDNK